MKTEYMTTASPSSDPHQWHFFRSGGLDQIEFRDGNDLLHLEELDEKLWVALSCPTSGMECDEATLRMIDTDKDGRVRKPELITAIQWAASQLKDAGILINRKEALPLEAIDVSTERGVSMVNAAREILRSVNKAEATEITVEDTSQRTSVFEKARFNGDGVVPPSSAEDPGIAKAIEDIVKSTGGIKDRNGEPGVNREKLDAFYDQATHYLDWKNQGSPDSSPAGFDAFKRIKVKVEDHFARCRLVAFDPRSKDHLSREAREYQLIAEMDLSTLPPEVTSLPLAEPNPEIVLKLDGNLNPAWWGAVSDFTKLVVRPRWGNDRTEISESEWAEIKNHFSSQEVWESARSDFTVHELGIERIEELISGDFRPAIEALIAEDLEMADEVAAVDDLDRLTRYQRDLHLLARNFVSFTDFFSLTQRAIFQAGTLYLDGRSCDLCLKVANPTAHAVIANLSRCYVAYCRCERTGHPPMTIAAVISNGDSDDLMIGRNGAFYDREGRDWHATVVKLLENPISIQQAFWLPYKKFVRFVDAQLTKRAEAADKATTEKLSSTASSLTHIDKDPKAVDQGRFDAGTVAALGVGLGSIGTFLTMILIRAIELGPWLPFAFIGIILLISFPSMFLAWIKLRQRTLGPILDANGWAVNGRIKINVSLARSLTHLRKIPPGSTRTLSDPFADKAGNRRKVLIVIALILALGLLGFISYRSDLPPEPMRDQTLPPALKTETAH